MFSLVWLPTKAAPHTPTGDTTFWAHRAGATAATMMRFPRYRAAGSNPGGSEQGRPPPRARPPRRRRLGVAIGAGASACWLAGAQVPDVAAVFQPKDNDELETAVGRWAGRWPHNDWGEARARAEYGDISGWDTSLVTDM